MNKQTRLVVSLLFIGIIVLAVAITRFYSRTEKSAVSSGSQTVIEKKLGFDSAGNRAFQNSEGLVGIIDSSEHVIVSPEWQSIRFTGNKERCIASKRIHGKELYGCIDYEGNIIVPFVYSNIDLISSAERVLYIARAADNKSSVVYNSSFDPCFPNAWDTCKYNSGELSVTSGSGTYTYSVKNSDFIFKKAVINGSCMNCPYSMNIEVSGLTVPMMEKIDSTVGKYLRYAYAGKASLAKLILDDMDKTDSSNFSRLFQNEKPVTSRKLISLPNITVSSVSSKDGIPHYEARVTADTGIVYRDDNDTPHKLHSNYTAVIEFAGTSYEDLKAVSGRFEEEKPDYPVIEQETQPEDQQEVLPQEN